MKIHTISFFAPYWELVFRGKLALGQYQVKTRSNDNYKHRGLILCYTALNSHPGPLRAHDLIDGDVPRGVVGCAELVHVRQLDDDEKRELFRGYNDRHLKGIGGAPSPIPTDAIYAMDYGYFLKPVFRFRKPFIPPVQHMYGPVGRIPLYPEIERQLPTWAKQKLKVAA